MLTRCEWFHPISDGSYQSLANTSKINAERFEECYYLNNSKADFLLKIKDKP